MDGFGWQFCPLLKAFLSPTSADLGLQHLHSLAGLLTQHRAFLMCFFGSFGVALTVNTAVNCPKRVLQVQNQPAQKTGVEYLRIQGGDF
jgi:hypothetical protein